MSKIVNLTNPQPILQQDKSSIVTSNPLIPNEQKEREIIVTDISNTANNNNANAKNTVKNMSIQDINKKIGTSVIGFFDDLFLKPENVPWKEYLPTILQKDERYTYIGILCILIGFYLLLARSN
jgi:hypothetical protein